MKADKSFWIAFRRAASFLPAAGLTVETGQGTLAPDGMCAVSFDPPIVGLTFPSGVPAPPGQFSVSTALVKFDCTLTESRAIGDHVMVLAAVERLEVRVGTPAIQWRRASFHLRLEYPFLESAEALEEFVDGWHEGTLAKAAWTHAAHVAVTGYYAFDSPAENVFAEMKRGIRHFNSCTGVVNGPDSGYHETLTRFWCDKIKIFLRNAGPASRLEAAICAVRRFGEDRDLPALYYSFDVVRDRRARGEWVPPDREPLAEWCGQ